MASPVSGTTRDGYSQRTSLTYWVGQTKTRTTVAYTHVPIVQNFLKQKEKHKKEERILKKNRQDWDFHWCRLVEHDRRMLCRQLRP